jgi:hypothetical protein
MRFSSVLAAFGLTLMSMPVLAQSQGDVCYRLQAQLSATEQRGASPTQIARYEDALARQQYELDRTIGMARGMGCGRISIFGPPPPPQCRDLDRRIARMEANIDQLIGQLQQARGSDGSQSARRQQILATMAQNRCGQQYQAVPQQQRQGGLFGLLFGGGSQQQEQIVPQGPVEPPRMSTLRTVCVRKCDGFFFPISYATGQGKIGSDEAICKRTCPGAEAELYSYPTNGDIAQASSAHGEPYTRLPNAFKYQKEFVASCSCKPQNMTWSEAVQDGDSTLRKGDIVVDEARSRQLSQPRADAARTATPAEAARASREAAQDSTDSVVEEDVQTSTEDAPAEEANPNVRSVGPTFFPD